MWDLRNSNGTRRRYTAIPLAVACAAPAGSAGAAADELAELSLEERFSVCVMGRSDELIEALARIVEPSS